MNIKYTFTCRTKISSLWPYHVERARPCLISEAKQVGPDFTWMGELRFLKGYKRDSSMLYTLTT